MSELTKLKVEGETITAIFLACGMTYKQTARAMEQMLAWINEDPVKVEIHFDYDDAVAGTEVANE